MATSARMTGKFLNLKEDDKALLCLSPKTIAGKMMIVRSIVLGMQLFVTELNSNPLKGTKQRFDFVAMVPMQLGNSINLELESVSRIKTIIVGGGVVSEELNNKLKNLSCSVLHTFGMTETISHIAMRNLSKGEKEFKALPNVSFELEDSCLTIHAPDLGVSGLKTNDIVKLSSPTSFVWKGRNDFVINSGGIKIHPEEVEKKLSSKIDAPFFVTGLKDEKLGNKLVLCVESNSTATLSKNVISDSLTAYQTPKEVYYFDEFSRTQSGKINRLETVKLISNASKKIL